MVATLTPSRYSSPLVPVPATQIRTATATAKIDWLWHGLIARRHVTLLTSRWKAGKTTLLTGLMQQFEKGGKFLERTVAPAKVLFVSEESAEIWLERLQRMPVGEHLQILQRPFLGRPTVEQLDQIVELGMEMQAAGDLDLLVIDPLAKFLPGGSENSLNALQQTLKALQCLCDGGAGVAILHHPRRQRTEEGSVARGHGGLLAAVDIIVELSAYGPLHSDECRRKLFALSRFPDTPKRLVYEWVPKTGRFRFLGDPLSVRFHENWEHVYTILKGRTQAATHQELLMDWPADLERPSPATLYSWLNLAFEKKLLRRQGNGRCKDPYRYRLTNEDDEYLDRGEIPPMKELDLREIFGR